MKGSQGWPPLAAWIRLSLGALAILLVAGAVLPRLSRVGCFEVVRSNLERDFDATGYFYTEVEDFRQYEEGASRLFSRTARVSPRPPARP